MILWCVFADTSSFLPATFASKEEALTEMHHLSSVFPRVTFYCGKLISKIEAEISEQIIDDEIPF